MVYTYITYGFNTIICIKVYPLVSVIPLNWILHMFFLQLYAFLYHCSDMDRKSVTGVDGTNQNNDPLKSDWEETKWEAQ